MSIKSEWNALVHDWYKYMNTTIPKGVDGRIYTDTIYTNRDRMQELRDKYPEIDSNVVEQEALHEFFKKSDEEIENQIGKYYLVSDTSDGSRNYGKKS